MHLECELHNLTQGEMSANDFYHRLQQLANSLVDCDALIISYHALVHQHIQGLNPKFSMLKTLLPLLPKFSMLIKELELILSEETYQEAKAKRIVETTLLAVGSASQKTNNTPVAQPN
jgi:hypothetical protein